MFTLRCTRRLLERFGEPAADVPAPTTVLGDWYANLLNVGRLRLVLCTSERTLLTVLVPAKDVSALPDQLRIANSCDASCIWHEARAVRPRPLSMRIMAPPRAINLDAKRDRTAGQHSEELQNLSA